VRVDGIKIMSDPSFDNRASDKWGRENQHWILLAQIVFWGMLGWFVVSAFFGDHTTANPADYPESVQYENAFIDAPETCYGRGGSFPC
jgi:hypothetical protein